MKLLDEKLGNSKPLLKKNISLKRPNSSYSTKKPFRKWV